MEAVSKSSEEPDDIVDFLVGQCWRVAAFAPKRGIPLDVVTILGRQVVELDHVAVVVCWIPSLRVRIPLRIKRHRFFQCVEYAVMKECPTRRDIAESRSDKAATVPIRLS